MRLVFAGTPAFATASLAALDAAGHEIVLVLTQPDRTAGRGLTPHPSAVKEFAIGRGLALFQPPTLRDPGALDRLDQAGPEVIVVAAYGLILPQAALDLPPRGALNVHASLLPRWRGAAPIQRAILAGDEQTGISIMRMEAGLDTGPVLAQRAIAINDEDDAGSLHDKLARLGAEMIVESVAAVQSGTLAEQLQTEAGVTYASKIERADALLDWTRAAAVLERTVRALRPSPGASTTISGVAAKIWRATVAPGRGTPGAVLRAGPEGLIVACGAEALAITELQRAGGKRMPVGDFLRGQSIAAGQRLGT